MPNRSREIAVRYLYNGFSISRGNSSPMTKRHRPSSVNCRARGQTEYNLERNTSRSSSKASHSNNVCWIVSFSPLAVGRRHLYRGTARRGRGKVRSMNPCAWVRAARRRPGSCAPTTDVCRKRPDRRGGLLAAALDRGVHGQSFREEICCARSLSLITWILPLSYIL